MRDAPRAISALQFVIGRSLRTCAEPLLHDFARRQSLKDALWLLFVQNRAQSKSFEATQVGESSATPQNQYVGPGWQDRSPLD